MFLSSYSNYSQLVSTDQINRGSPEMVIPSCHLSWPLRYHSYNRQPSLPSLRVGCAWPGVTIPYGNTRSVVTEFPPTEAQVVSALILEDIIPLHFCPFFNLFSIPVRFFHSYDILDLNFPFLNPLLLLPFSHFFKQRGMFTASARSRLSTTFTRQRLSPTPSILARSVST